MSEPSKQLDYGGSPSNPKRRFWVAIFAIALGIVGGPLGLIWAELDYYGGFPSSPCAIILFPFAMMTGYVTLSDMMVLLVQFPIYGIIIGTFTLFRRLRYGILLVAIIHTAGVFLCYLYKH